MEVGQDLIESVRVHSESAVQGHFEQLITPNENFNHEKAIETDGEQGLQEGHNGRRHDAQLITPEEDFHDEKALETDGEQDVEENEMQGNQIDNREANAISFQNTEAKDEVLAPMNLRLIPRSRVYLNLDVSKLKGPQHNTWDITVNPQAAGTRGIIRNRLSHGTVSPRGMLLKSGTWCYRMKIKSLQGKENHFRVGWGTSAYISKSWKGNIDLVGDNRRSWALAFDVVEQESRSKGRADGFFMNARHKPVACGPSVVRVGDVVTVAVDLDRRVMRFGVNQEHWNRDGLLEQERGEVKAWGSVPLTLRFDADQLAQGVFPAISIPLGSQVELDFDDSPDLSLPPGWESTCQAVSKAFNSVHNLYLTEWIERETRAEHGNSFSDFWQLLPYLRDESGDDNSNALVRYNLKTDFDNVRISDNGADELADYIADHFESMKLSKEKLELRLSHNQLRTLGQLPAVLASLKGLCNIDLRFNRIDDEGAIRLGSILHKLENLTKLDLSQNQIQNPGAQVISKQLTKNQSIKWFSIASNGLSEMSGQAFKDVITENQVLEHLSLSDNCLGDVGVADIARGLTELHSIEYSRLVKLKSINLSRCRVGKAGVEALASALESNTNLLELILQSNALSAMEIVDLCSKGLSGNLYLESLDLSRNPIGDPGGMAVAQQFLSRSTTLQRLQLKDVQLTHISVQHLAKGLQTSTSLQDLDLSWNHIGDTGAMFLAEAIPFVATLRTLNLSKCGLENTGGLAILRALSEYQCELDSLQIQYNSLGGKDGLVGLAIAQLCSSGNVKRFNLINNKFGSNEAFAISQALAVSKSKVVEIKATGNPISAESIRRIETAPHHRRDAMEKS